MRRPSVALVAALTLVGAQSSLAQAPARPSAQAPLPVGIGEVRGTVVEAAGGAPITQASVAVRTRRDSALVAGALVNAQGAYRIQGLRPGAYLLRVTALGYGPRVQRRQPQSRQAVRAAMML